jgi:hypothetical protein
MIGAMSLKESGQVVSGLSNAHFNRHASAIFCAKKVNHR